MNFVIDLDSTLMNLPVLERACELLGREGEFSMLDARDWCMTTLPEPVRAKAYELFEDPDFMCTLTPNPGAERFVAQLCRKGHNVWIATCRNKQIHDATKRMVASYFPGTATVTLLASETKQALYRKLATDVAIDDCPANVAAAIMVGVPCVLMYSDSKTPYNWRLREALGVDMEDLLVRAETDNWKAN